MTFPVVLAVFTILFFIYYRSQVEILASGQSFPLFAQTIVLSKQGRFIMACLVSLAVLGSALYIILSRAFPESAEKWAFGAVGTVLGFWLRPEK